jgi:hypothetical protein
MIYAIELDGRMQLVGRNGDRLIWCAGAGGWMNWPDRCIVKKRYQVRKDDFDKVWLRFYLDFPLKPNTPKVSEGWLSPDGDFFACGHMEHDALAEHLSAQYYNSLDDTKFLGSKGWGRVWTSGLIGFEDHDPTQKQLDAMFDLAMVEGAKWKDELLENIKRDRELIEWREKN